MLCSNMQQPLSLFGGELYLAGLESYKLVNQVLTCGLAISDTLVLPSVVSTIRVTAIKRQPIGQQSHLGPTVNVQELVGR